VIVEYPSALYRPGQPELLVVASIAEDPDADVRIVSRSAGEAWSRTHLI
jgi:hypothetical protein